MSIARAILRSVLRGIWPGTSGQRAVAPISLVAFWACALCANSCRGDIDILASPIQPMLGRPTDTSVTVNVVSMVEASFYVKYGEAQGAYPLSTAPRHCEAGKSIEILVRGLLPDRAYSYTVMRLVKGDADPSRFAEGQFHTQRARGSPFLFTLQADVHLNALMVESEGPRVRQYGETLANVLAEGPDFHIDLGDFARMEVRGGHSTYSLRDATYRYLAQRYCLGAISPSVPFYLVLGNHEAEQGWRLLEGSDSLVIWATLARKSLVPNPYPDSFYSGNADTTGCCGLREDYYAWEWGDALFVVLDPFWYTAARPHGVVGMSKPSLDGWDWTLGETQYNWLYDTLHRSSAGWKFVFAHQITGGVLGLKTGEGYYGRGGIDAARYSVAHHPTFEWGGEDSSGNFVFTERRPGWKHGPIHEMMVEEGVNIFFRGHDHVFVYESLDGIIYQTCPIPADLSYSEGYFAPDYFSTGIKVNNPGHLRVAVWPDSVRVDYIRSVLPEDEPLHEGSRLVRNGDVSHSYTLKKPQAGR